MKEAQEKSPAAQGVRDKLTLRISKELNAETKAEAKYIGSSQNDFLLVLIRIGLKCYKTNPKLSEAESAH